MLVTEKERLKLCQETRRYWQGIPGVESTAGKTLFATFYSGGRGEGIGNYVLLQRSRDGGAHWSEVIAAVLPGPEERTFDPGLWMDPLGRLWWFWSQCAGEHWDGKGGVWFSRCERPDEEDLIWTEPVRFANGIMMNKPTVLQNGDWLFPCAVWDIDKPGVLAEERSSNVYISRDRGETFALYGRAFIPDRSCDEHMVLELRDGRLLMLVRTNYGIGKSYSADGGKTWTPGEDSGLGGPCSRFFIRRLASGRILLVNHYQFEGRNNLTAMLSEDESATWQGFLLLDGRAQVSYPDGAEDKQGNLYIIYDRERGCRYKESFDNSADAREILLARITEEDILAGKLVSLGGRLQILVSKLTGIPAEPIL